MARFGVDYLSSLPLEKRRGKGKPTTRTKPLHLAGHHAGHSGAPVLPACQNYHTHFSAGEAEARELKGLSAQVLIAHICGCVGIMNPSLQSSKPEFFPFILPAVM